MADKALIGLCAPCSASNWGHFRIPSLLTCASQTLCKTCNGHNPLVTVGGDSSALLAAVPTSTSSCSEQKILHMPAWGKLSGKGYLRGYLRKWDARSITWLAVDDSHTLPLAFLHIFSNWAAYSRTGNIGTCHCNTDHYHGIFDYKVYFPLDYSVRDFFPSPEESLDRKETCHVRSLRKGNSRVNYNKWKVPDRFVLIAALHVGY